MFGDALAATLLDRKHSIVEPRFISSALAPQREPKRSSMKKVKRPVADDDMLPEYDFSDAVRGKYFERFQQGSNLILLDPDVAAAFPSSRAVNEALRSLVSARGKQGRVIRRSPSPRRRPAKRLQRTSAKTGRGKPRS